MCVFGFNYWIQRHFPFRRHDDRKLSAPVDCGVAWRSNSQAPWVTLLIAGNPSGSIHASDGSHVRVDKARRPVRQAHASFAGVSTCRGELRAPCVARVLSDQPKLFKIVPEARRAPVSRYGAGLIHSAKAYHRAKAFKHSTRAPSDRTIALLEAHRVGLLRRQHWLPNIVSGVIVGVVALPLAMAFAIASGAKPEQGLYTAIVAGFVASAFGGSRVQISGPTGAFIVILTGITARHTSTGCRSRP